MMKISEELIQGFALGEAALSEHAEQVAGVLAIETDEAMMELESIWQDYLNEWQVYVNEHLATGDGAPEPGATERGVKARFLELLAQHPELTRPQAYMQAVMEIAELAIEAEVKSVMTETPTIMGMPVVPSDTLPDSIPFTLITFPTGTSREDFERMRAEIQAALDRAELRGEQKAMAFLMGEGSGTPVGIVGQPETKGSWISVDDGLPPDNEEVWVCEADANMAAIGYHNRYGWSDIYGEDDGLRDSQLYGVTHWHSLIRPAFLPVAEMEGDDSGQG